MSKPPPNGIVASHLLLVLVKATLTTTCMVCLRSLVAVWQAAPSAGNETHMRLGVEGLDVQHILISYSRDPEGNRWTSPQQVPIRQSGALWSPVLHVDIDGVLWLFYSESAYCRKAIPCRSCSFTPCEIKETSTLCHMEPKLWVPGGDLKVITSVGNLENNAWSPARTVLSQSGDGGIPKVISNRVTVLSTGEWLLPFWREQVSVHWTVIAQCSPRSFVLCDRAQGSFVIRHAGKGSRPGRRLPARLEYNPQRFQLRFHGHGPTGTLYDR